MESTRAGPHDRHFAEAKRGARQRDGDSDRAGERQLQVRVDRLTPGTVVVDMTCLARATPSIGE